MARSRDMPLHGSTGLNITIPHGRRGWSYIFSLSLPLEKLLDKTQRMCNTYYTMAKAKKRETMTRLLRQALLESDSLNAIQRATGLKRQALAKFMRGEQSLRLDLADKLASYFGIEIRKGK